MVILTVCRVLKEKIKWHQSTHRLVDNLHKRCSVHRKMQFIPVFLLVCFLFLFVVMISVNFNVGEGFLAYPPPPTWPAQDGYPAPGFASPTATQTQDTGFDLAATSTPWPTPTSYAVTPALTPRQGVAGGQQYYVDRYKFGSWAGIGDITFLHLILV